MGFTEIPLRENLKRPPILLIRIAGVYIFLFDPPPGGGQKYEVLRGWGKKMITSLSKKRKREGKSGKRERKRRKKEKRERKKKKRERKSTLRCFIAHTG